MLEKKKKPLGETCDTHEGSVRNHEQKGELNNIWKELKIGNRTTCVPKKKKRVLNCDQNVFSAIYILHLFFNSYVFIENRYESKYGSVREQTWFDVYLSGRWLGAAMRTVWEGDPLRAFQG